MIRGQEIDFNKMNVVTDSIGIRKKYSIIVAPSCRCYLPQTLTRTKLGAIIIMTSMLFTYIIRNCSINDNLQISGVVNPVRSWNRRQLDYPRRNVGTRPSHEIQ